MSALLGTPDNGVPQSMVEGSTGMEQVRLPSAWGVAAGLILLGAACAPAVPPAAAPTQAPKPAAAPAQPAAAPTQPAKPAAVATARPAAEKPVARGADPTPNPQARKGGTLTFATSKDVVALNPFIRTVSVGQYIKETMYEALLAQDTEGRIQPGLAESWELSPDAKQVTFKLRGGARFHNGKEVTADDVLWSINYVRDAKNAALGHAYLGSVEKVEKVDGSTVRISLKAPEVAFVSYMTLISVVPIVPADSVAPAQKDVGQSPPPGTGPFKFVQYQPNNQLVVERFDDYWGGAPYLDRVVFKVVPDESARFTALRAGDVQIAERIPDQWAPRIRKGEVRGIQLYQAKNSGYRFVAMNVHSPVLKDKAMREAVFHSIDRERVLKELYGEFATPVDIVAPPSSVWHKAIQPLVPSRTQDIPKVKQLLQQAGYQGQEISLVGRRGHGAWLESLQRMMTEAGLNVRLEVLESAILEQREGKGQFDLNLTGSGVEDDPSITMKKDFYCVPPDDRQENEIGYCNPEADKLIDGLATELSDQRRLEIFKQLTNIIYDDYIHVPLGTEPRFFAWTDSVQDFQPTDGGNYLSRFVGLHKTWLKQ